MNPKNPIPVMMRVAQRASCLQTLVTASRILFNLILCEPGVRSSHRIILHCCSVDIEVDVDVDVDVDKEGMVGSSGRESEQDFRDCLRPQLGPSLN